MRVLHLINGLGAGGAERSLAEMLPLLAEDGIDPVVATFVDRPEGVEADVRAAGFDVRRVTATGWARRILAVRALVRDLRPEVVHTSLFEADVVGRLAAAGRRGTVVATSLVNTSYSAERLADPNVSARKLEAVRRIDALTARRFTRGFHAITGAVADAAVADLGIARESVTVIPRGRSRTRLGEPGPERRRRARAALGLDDDAPVIATVGRREHQKGQVTLIRAFAELRRGHPTAVLLLAGREGNASAAIDAEIATCGVGDAVHLLGHVGEVGDVLAASDVFAFPSVYEGLGGALLEAMAMEVPIVASDVPAIREVLGEGAHGTLVPRRDPAALAASVDAVLRDRAAVGPQVARARAAFDEHYGLDAVGRRMAAWLRAVAATGDRSAAAPPYTPARPHR